MSTPSFRTVSTPVAGAPPYIPMPTGVQVGDLLIAVVWGAPSASVPISSYNQPSANSGWAVLGGPFNTSSWQVMLLFRRANAWDATNGGGAGYGLNVPGAQGGIIFAYAGAGGVDVVGGGVFSSTANLVTGSVVTTQPNETLVDIYTQAGTGLTSPTPNPPTGTTLRFARYDGSQFGYYVVDRSQTFAGTSTADPLTASSRGESIGVTLALQQGTGIIRTGDSLDATNIVPSSAWVATGGTELTLPIPSQTQSGDLMIMFLNAWGATTGWSTPPGWTPIPFASSLMTGGPAPGACAAFSRVASSEPSSYPIASWPALSGSYQSLGGTILGLRGAMGIDSALGATNGVNHYDSAGIGSIPAAGVITSIPNEVILMSVSTPDGHIYPQPPVLMNDLDTTGQYLLATQRTYAAGTVAVPTFSLPLGQYTHAYLTMTVSVVTGVSPDPIVMVV